LSLLCCVAFGWDALQSLRGCIVSPWWRQHRTTAHFCRFFAPVPRPVPQLFVTAERPVESSVQRDCDSAPGHHQLTPNRSRLGVFTSRPRNVRGVHAHSACARGWSEPVPVVACSTLFCPLFSGNLRQLFHRSTRTSPCAATTCTCVGVFWFAARSGVADHQAAAKSGDAHGIEYTPWRRLDFTSAR